MWVTFLKVKTLPIGEMICLTSQIRILWKLLFFRRCCHII